jgi:hypothetical protein
MGRLSARSRRRNPHKIATSITEPQAIVCSACAAGASWPGAGSLSERPPAVDRLGAVTAGLCAREHSVPSRGPRNHRRLRAPCNRPCSAPRQASHNVPFVRLSGSVPIGLADGCALELHNCAQSTKQLRSFGPRHRIADATKPLARKRSSLISFLSPSAISDVPCSAPSIHTPPLVPCSGCYLPPRVPLFRIALLICQQRHTHGQDSRT